MKLGDRVKDKFNGFIGITTGRTEYINGCRQFLVKPEKLDKDGKPQDALWLDEQNLELVTPGVMSDPFASMNAPAIAGGPDSRERRRE